MLQLVAIARASSSRAVAAAFSIPSVYNFFLSPLDAGQSLCSSSAQQQRQWQGTQQQQFSNKANSDESYSPRSSSSSSPEAVTSKGDPAVNDSRSNSDEGHTTFTGTADVFTPSNGNATQKQQPTVVTDSNRSWMSGDDLGTRVEAVTSDNSNTTASPGQQQQNQQQGEGATLGVDAAAPECHPADPYCQAGENTPMPDGFHEPEPGDDHIPPSSGFPA